jgi:hypothetical protein
LSAAQSGESRWGTRGGSGRANEEISTRSSCGKVERNAHHPEGVRNRLVFMFIRSGEETPTILYDNHHPKGHHRRIGKHEEPYKFLTARRLVPDLLAQARALAGDVK